LPITVTSPLSVETLTTVCIYRCRL